MEGGTGEGRLLVIFLGFFWKKLTLAQDSLTRYRNPARIRLVSISAVLSLLEGFSGNGKTLLCRLMVW